MPASLSAELVGNKRTLLATNFKGVYARVSIIQLNKPFFAGKHLSAVVGELGFSDSYGTCWNPDKVHPHFPSKVAHSFPDMIY